MSKPARPKILTQDNAADQEKKRLAEERARRSARSGRGVAANILAQADTFGSGASARTTLGGVG